MWTTAAMHATTMRFFVLSVTLSYTPHHPGAVSTTVATYYDPGLKIRAVLDAIGTRLQQCIALCRYGSFSETKWRDRLDGAPRSEKVRKL